MTPKRWQKWVVFAAVLALMVPMASMAFAGLDEFGGGSFVAEYAPYTAGPVVSEEPYAPYTAGPVVREQFYAPYTPGPMNYTHWMIR